VGWAGGEGRDEKPSASTSASIASPKENPL
jgi:hypothetical protein